MKNSVAWTAYMESQRTSFPNLIRNQVAGTGLISRHCNTSVEAEVTAAVEDVGNYRINRSGAMGAVYEVEHRLLKQNCALKILSPDRIADHVLAEQLHAEAKAAQ